MCDGAARCGKLRLQLQGGVVGFQSAFDAATGCRCGVGMSMGQSFKDGLLAGRDGAGLDALASFSLGDPAGVDDDVQIVLGNGDGLEED